MSYERVKAIATDPRITRKELEQMRANAIEQRNVEAVEVIENVLRDRFPKSVGSIDRDSPTDAADVMESLFPRKLERTAILARLLKSVAIADAAAPNAWAVSLFPEYFRLNVGQVEVYVAYPGGFFLNCSASTDRAPFNADGFTAVNYKSVPSPQCHFRGTAGNLKALPSEVEKAHAKFIELAAQAPSGKARAGTPLKKSHSEGLLKYARQVVGKGGV